MYLKEFLHLNVSGFIDHPVSTPDRLNLKLAFCKKWCFFKKKKRQTQSVECQKSVHPLQKCKNCNFKYSIYFHLTENDSMNLIWNIYFQEISRTRVSSFTRANTERKRQERLPLCYFLRIPRTKLSAARLFFFSFHHFTSLLVLV